FGTIELTIDKLDAKPGAQFYLARDSRLSTIEEIQKHLTVLEQGRQSGVLSATLQGSDPVIVSGILNEIGKEYMRQNADRKTEEANKALANLNRQLPE